MVELIGHRGGMGIWPENTIAGFVSAAATGVEFIEPDVHLSRDGQVIVMHDISLERTTQGRGLVRLKTAEELSRIPILNAGGECVSTLDRVLAALRPLTVGILIELKTDPLAEPYPEMEAKVLQLVDHHDLRQRVRFICFVPEILERLRALWPEAEVAAPLHRASVQMLGGLRRAITRFKAIPGCIINIERSMLELCYDEARLLVPDRQLGVGGVHDEAGLRLWLPRPVRQLATNFPDLAASIRRDLASG